MPQTTLIYKHFLVCQNELKPTYSNVGIQKFSGGETHGPPGEEGRKEWVGEGEGGERRIGGRGSGRGRV